MIFLHTNNFYAYFVVVGDLDDQVEIALDQGKDIRQMSALVMSHIAKDAEHASERNLVIRQQVREL